MNDALVSSAGLSAAPAERSGRRVVFTAVLALICASGLRAEPLSAETLAGVVERTAPRLMVSASLMAWSIFSPDVTAEPVLVLPDGRPATYRDGLSQAGSVTALLAMATLAAGNITSDFPDTADRLTRVTSVIASSYTVRTYLKGAIQRTRPYAAGTSPDPAVDPDELRSFPSGHSLLAWACVGDALVTTLRQTTRPWLLAVVAIEAASTSALRVAAGEHYVGDVIAGALIGMATGSLVSLLSR